MQSCPNWSGGYQKLLDFKSGMLHPLLFPPFIPPSFQKRNELTSLRRLPAEKSKQTPDWNYRTFFRLTVLCLRKEIAMRGKEKKIDALHLFMKSRSQRQWTSETLVAFNWKIVNSCLSFFFLPQKQPTTRGRIFFSLCFLLNCFSFSSSVVCCQCSLKTRRRLIQCQKSRKGKKMLVFWCWCSCDSVHMHARTHTRIHNVCSVFPLCICWAISVTWTLDFRPRPPCSSYTSLYTPQTPSYF